jgi:hypothetical protein
MEENTAHATLYKQGFNEGYIIAKHLPDLSDTLATVASTAPRIEGFQDGRKQFVLEQVRDRRREWAKGPAKIAGNGKQQDRDIEPDR